MDSSPGFGPHPGNPSRPLQTRFRCGSTALPPLNLWTPSGPGCHDELAGSFYKRHAVTRDPKVNQAPTAGKCRGSGSLSFPARGAFHLSLTVLVHYRWPEVFSLGGWSPQLPTGLLVSRGTQGHSPSHTSSRTGLSPALVGLSRTLPLAAVVDLYSDMLCPTTPRPAYAGPGLGSSRFARHYYGNLC